MKEKREEKRERRERKERERERERSDDANQTTMAFFEKKAACSN